MFLQLAIHDVIFGRSSCKKLLVSENAGKLGSCGAVVCSLSVHIGGEDMFNAPGPRGTKTGDGHWWHICVVVCAHF